MLHFCQWGVVVLCSPNPYLETNLVLIWSCEKEGTQRPGRVAVGLKEKGWLPKITSRHHYKRLSRVLPLCKYSRPPPTPPKGTSFSGLHPLLPSSIRITFAQVCTLGASPCFSFLC